VLGGQRREQFIVDPYQAGAGTSHNVNAELANRANEWLGGVRGANTPVHPNNHVNMAQSTNDTIPTNIRPAILWRLPALLVSIDAPVAALEKKGVEFDGIVKAERTHLQDDMPIRLGQEFTAYAGTLARCRKRRLEAADYLNDLGIGGSAVGTGVTVEPEYPAHERASAGDHRQRHAAHRSRSDSARAEHGLRGRRGDRQAVGPGRHAHSCHGETGRATAPPARSTRFWTAGK
jgi:aspartate ammonia-lyase